MTDTLEDVLARYGVKDLNWKLEHANVNTSTTAVIVALPYAMDPIRLVGDEDKHATLMFFGEIQSLEAGAKDEIVRTLNQVSKMVSPFGESVVGIQRLGTDTPPALVAMLTNRQLETVRNVISVNPKVQGYLENTQQYPTYTPHITLGYPDYKGEADIRTMAQQLNRVRFDRLALWWGDEQIEFPLNSFGEDTADAAWSEELVSDFLAHHGIKGMKWGVRRFGPSGSSSGRFTRGSKKATLPVSEDHKVAASARSKPVSLLSNHELQALITRMDLEQRYSKLVEKAPPPETVTRLQRGRAFVGHFIAKQANTQLNRVVTKAIDVQVENVLGKKKMTPAEVRTEVANRIAPKQKEQKKNKDTTD